MRMLLVFIVVIGIAGWVSCFGPLDPYDPDPELNVTASDTAKGTQSTLAAYWKCDDSTGTKLTDEVADADGSISGAVFDSGVDRTALRLDGSDDIVMISTADRKVFDLGTGEFTLSLWVKPALYQYSDTIRYVILSNGVALERGFTLAIYNKRFTALLGKNTGESKDTLFKANEEKWRHVVLLRRKASVELYINGRLTQTLTYEFNLSGTDGKWFIGDDASNTNGNRFAGRIDEIKFSKSAWDIAKIRSEFTMWKIFTE